jgi:hypothetical protein
MRSKAGRILGLIEAWCPVPEGKLMGEWMVLENWQRESLYQIYNNTGKGGNGQGNFLPEIELKLGRVDTHALALAFVQAEDHGGERRKRQFEALRARVVRTSRSRGLRPTSSSAETWSCGRTRSRPVG